ncbi:MAG: hypothetical protein LBM95_05170 [Lactobacillales bacterium]|nr:hypothetical protein [Lactobacillales bacterium]
MENKKIKTIFCFIAFLFLGLVLSGALKAEATSSVYIVKFAQKQGEVLAKDSTTNDGEYLGDRLKDSNGNEVEFLSGVDYLITELYPTGSERINLEDSTTFTEGKQQTVTTDEQGKVNVELEDGHYKIEELEDTRIAKPMNPIHLSLPVTNAEGTGFVNPVYIYPKSNLVSTDAFASLRIQKVSKTGNVPLKGASFKLSLTEKDATNSKFLHKNVGGVVDITSATTGADIEVTTDEKGTTTIDMIPLELDENNNSIARTLWLTETKTPTGYVPLTAPQKVLLNEGSNEITIVNEEKEDQGVLPGTFEPISVIPSTIGDTIGKIANNELPDTGELLTSVSTLGALLLLFSYGIYYLRKDKKKE